MTPTTPAAEPARAHDLIPRRILYARALLNRGGFHHGDAQVRCLVAVMVGEGSQAHWNPLDTTLPEPGATPYNSIGTDGTIHVWNYPNAQTGVAATLATMHQTNMAPWASQLRNPKATAEQCCAGFAATAWAYVGDRAPEAICADWETGARNYRDDYSQIVAGPGDWPYGIGV